MPEQSRSRAELDFSSRFGRTAQRRLRQEQIIWLTTVDAHQVPQPRPVWFHWDGQTVLIFSQPNAGKVRHIARHPHVALHFNTDAAGGAVVVLLGEAVCMTGPVPSARLRSYMRKYRAGIRSLQMTPAQLVREYSVAISVTPTSLRGF